MGIATIEVLDTARDHPLADPVNLCRILIGTFGNMVASTNKRIKACEAKTVQTSFGNFDGFCRATGVPVVGLLELLSDSPLPERSIGEMRNDVETRVTH